MRAHPLLIGLVALASIGCGDPSGPSPANLQLSVSTVGVDQDDSYAVRAGDGPSRPIGSFLSLFLPPGEHEVVLDGIAPNCSVQGPDSVRVTITLGRVASVAFQVECRAVTGAIEVAAPTSGRDFDSDGYTVQVDDVPRTQVFAGGSVVVEGVLPGAREVRLDDFSTNCHLIGSASQTVLVTAGGLTRDTVRAIFEGSCEAIAGDVQLLTTTRGVQRDQNGYTVTADGQLVLAPCGFNDYYCDAGVPLMLVPNGSYMFIQVAAGDHTYQLGDVASNCTVLDGNSRTVAVSFGETSVVRFEVTCDP